MIDKEWLRKKYVDERLSTYQIAKLCGTTPSVIKGQMRRYNIPYRSHSEIVIYPKKHLIIKFRGNN